MSKEEDTLSKIAGSIVLSKNPGAAMRMWRERFGIKQNALAKEMGISPSVLSDYECGRRISPGVEFVKRYVQALASLDKSGRKILEVFKPRGEERALLAIGEFSRPVRVSEVLSALKADVLKGKELLETLIYGYTVLDSIRAIYALSGQDFYSLFGATTERVMVFTKVGLGRSPLVAIRVSHLKPRVVVLHGPKIVDSLAVSLAEKEKIVLALSKLEREEAFKDILEKF